ncbi:MAG: hypothetical protein MI785_21470 [Kiloniellales bacterium]|nr:hypothetical protein [Kiloniellales bacterium]
MFGLLRGVFGGAAAPPSELALRLAEYVGALVAVGARAPDVDEVLADPKGCFKPPEGTNPKGLIELPLEAQMYLSCFTIQSFIESGSTDSKEAAAVMNYVLETAGRCTRDQVTLVASLGMRLRGIIAKEPAEDEDWERGLRTYVHIGEAAVAAAGAFMARVGSGDRKPTPAEVAHFLRNCIKRDPQPAGDDA